MKLTKQIGLLIAMLVFVTTGWADDNCEAQYGDGAVQLRLATGSPGELGLVEVLASAFNEAHGTSNG